MPTAGIKVLFIGKSWKVPYDVKVLERISDLFGTIAVFDPDVIVTSEFVPGALQNWAFEYRKKWIHVDLNASDAEVQQAIESCYAGNLWGEHVYQKYNPLMSVYTPTYNTGDFLRDTYQSLRDQTYPNWEWVVVDDHSSDATWERLEALAKEDPRVRPFRSGKRIGKIGATKDLATRLCRGEYLVELDHDDMLADFALEEIKKAFESDPEIGMVYSNCTNFFQNGGWHQFNDEFWKNRYRWTEYRGKKWLECIQPDIYDRFGPEYWQQFGWFLTVGPNHVRAYRASKFRELGGYNPNLPVADDWDLFARFFLYSKCYRIDKMLYLYRFLDRWENTTFARNKSIQDHLELGRNHYAEEFKRVNEARKRSKNVTTSGIDLTIVVPAIPARMKTTLIPVVEELFRQAEGKPVQVVCMLDNRTSNLSEKRNEAIANAKGRFIAFVDDDDWVEPDYVDSILKAISENPDADCVVFDVLVHGYDREPKVCKYGVELTHGKDDKAYYRKPNHVMAYRTAIARKHKYRVDRSALDEDTEWAARAHADIKKQVRIDKILYHYRYSEKDTTQAKKRVSESCSAVSVVVLEAVPSKLTVDCLESIRAHAPEAEVVLVANGCEPFKRALDLADKVIRLEANLGFAAGCNAGAKAATRPILCFLNNDAKFVDKTPEKLLKAMTEQYPIVAPYSNRAKPPQGDWERSKVPNQEMYPEMVVGMCVMMPAKVYWELGGFDPRLLTYEDDDFCVRARLKGYGCKVVAGTYVEHERHATFKALKLDVDKVMAENEKIFARKNPRIRVVAIAKNEEKALWGFFDQFKPVTRDWCLLDTGSTDQTVEVAKAMGVRVERGEFRDFASARNEALDRFGKDCDWVIMLDPDERLDGHTIEHLRELVFNAQHDIYLAPLQAVYPNKTTRQFVSKAFLFRSSPAIRWIFKVHEKLIGSHEQALVENGMINHIIELHEDERRKAAGAMYDRLAAEEPYFTDSEYRARMRREWPILDYDRMDDDRIQKIKIGPLVSVVIPTYRRPRMVVNAIRSALNQDYANLEVLVIGDNCPDLHNVQLADRVRVFNLPKNHGAGGAEPRNYGIRLAAGRLIAYLDDDNQWTRNHVSSLYEAMRKTGSAFAFSSMSVNGRDLKFKSLKQFEIDTSCVLHEKDLIDKYGWWKDRTEVGYAHDWEFFSRWVNEKWVCSRMPTLLYNADSSGQKEFLLARVQEEADCASSRNDRFLH